MCLPDDVRSFSATFESGATALALLKPDLDILEHSSHLSIKAVRDLCFGVL